MMHGPINLRYLNFVVRVCSNDPHSYAGGCVAGCMAPMPDRSKVMTQKERDNVVLHVVGRCVRLTDLPP